MITLALDTSHPVGSVALATNGVVLGEARFEAPSSHLVELSMSVERLLASNHLTIRNVDRVAVVLGPGSFTGVRIGLAFAKGLAAAGKELVAAGSLHLIAWPLVEQYGGFVCAMIDAKRGEVYAGGYERAQTKRYDDLPTMAEVLPARAEPPHEFLNAVAGTGRKPGAFAGTGALLHADAIRERFPSAEIVSEAHAFPSTSYLAKIGHLLPVFTPDAIRALEPVYLRASGAERKRLRAHAKEVERDGR
ncbi:MAG TPA: tRNA (adenosine(37)-N6)-threonylcarbamoyltransferase complex dimerization subunit type 1 TsaB [Candidatus Krumholzibacteria bacterium]|nr:tRNA (adenosine(37)-N6)-threonylcarbamoyltransferase complex dimerization subunit type 1 TsaB [Candidatus Krumholzibacteria bacterium]